MTQAGVMLSVSNSMSLLDYINMNFSDRITLSEFTHIRNCGSEEEIAEAVARMEAAGGYDCLED